MTHNFSIKYKLPKSDLVRSFQTSAKCLDDAMINLYDVHEDAIYLDNDIDINPATYESDSDTIQAAIINRQK